MAKSHSEHTFNREYNETLIKVYQQVINDLTNDPTQYIPNLSPKEIKQIKNMSDFEKGQVWNIFQAGAQEKFVIQNPTYQFFHKDINELVGDVRDIQNIVHYKKDFDKLMKHPENPIYKLTIEHITYIQGLNESEREEYWEQMKSANDLHENQLTETLSHIGGRILHAGTKILKVLGPVVIKLGSDAFEKVIAQAINNNAALSPEVKKVMHEFTKISTNEVGSGMTSIIENIKVESDVKTGSIPAVTFKYVETHVTGDLAAQDDAF